jgi:non-heme chloroperoxidase
MENRKAMYHDADKDAPHATDYAELTRRQVLAGAAAALLLGSVESGAFAAQPQGGDSRSKNSGELEMDTITTKDGVRIFYKDWGAGQPLVFHHGWPLTADDWDAQMMYFVLRGFRVIAHDRRGHGRSTQTASGNDMDTYAADVAQLAAHLDLRNAIHVGHSTGGGEVARYVARHGQPQGRVAKAVLIGAVPPIMVKSDKNPGGLPLQNSTR